MSHRVMSSMGKSKALRTLKDAGVNLVAFSGFSEGRRAAKRPALSRALVPLRGKVYDQSSRFPETATTSLGVLRPWPLPSSRLVSPEIRLP